MIVKHLACELPHQRYPPVRLAIPPPTAVHSVAGVAIAGLDAALAVRTVVLAVMTTKAARPDHVPDVIRVFVPLCFHLREEIVAVDLLNDVNGPSYALLATAEFFGWIAVGQDGGDAL